MCFQSYFMLSAHNKCDAYSQATLEKPKWNVCCLVSEFIYHCPRCDCRKLFLVFFSLYSFRNDIKRCQRNGRTPQSCRYNASKLNACI